MANITPAGTDDEDPTRIAPAQPRPGNPFERMASERLNAGAVAIEAERAIAEAQGKLVVAKRFPRDEMVAERKVAEACARLGLASVAFYTYKRGGSTISGPSIRLAEELARCWTNIDYGLTELSNREGETEMMAYAWDLEQNTISGQKFVVKHIRDKTGGGVALTEQRDIYELGANMGSRRMRSRILAILPAWYVDAAIAACKETISKGDGKPLIDRVRAMITAFEPLGVTLPMLIAKLGHPADQTTPDELVELTGSYRAIRDGMSTVQEEFGAKPTDSTGDAIKGHVAKNAAGAAAAATAGAAAATTGASGASATTTLGAPAGEAVDAGTGEITQAQPAKPPAAAAETAAPKTTPPADPKPEVLF